MNQRLSYSSRFCVYALCEPDSLSIRYVGKTNNLKVRIRRHIMDAENSRYHVHLWIHSLIARHLKPIVRVLQICYSDANALQAEVEWISIMRASGNDLCNLTDGGEGGSGYKPTPEILRRQSQALMGHSVSHEFRLNLSRKYRLLSSTQIEEIKRLKPTLSFSKLAKAYGVCPATIYNAINGKFYANNHSQS